MPNYILSLLIFPIILTIYFLTRIKKENRSKDGNLFKDIIDIAVDGKKFRVENNSFGSLKLYCEGRLVSEFKGMFAMDKKKPKITFIIESDEKNRKLEVYAYSIWTVNLKITLDGVRIAGDNF